MKKVKKLRVRLGPAGQGRRMGTEVIGEVGYRRGSVKKETRRRLVEETAPPRQDGKD